MFRFGRKRDVVKKKQDKKEKVKNKKGQKKELKVIVHRVCQSEYSHAQQEKHRDHSWDEVKPYKGINKNKKSQLPGVMHVRQYKNIHASSKNKRERKNNHKQ
jgi:hypothetical protein